MILEILSQKRRGIGEREGRGTKGGEKRGQGKRRDADKSLGYI